MSTNIISLLFSLFIRDLVNYDVRFDAFHAFDDILVNLRQLLPYGRLFSILGLRPRECTERLKFFRLGFFLV